MKLTKQFAALFSVMLIIAVLFSAISPLSRISVKADEYTHPDNMLYVKSSTTGPLKQRVEVVPGASYFFSFGLSDNSPAFTVIGQDKDRKSITVDPQEISKADQGDYTLYNYSLTIPADIPAQGNKYRVFIGLSFETDSDIYAFDFSLVKSDDGSKTNILNNGTFATNLNDWAWGDNPWFTTGQAGKGKTEWEDSNVTIKILSFDEKKFSNEKMLYFKAGNTGPLMTRINFVSGTEYRISFGLTNNITGFDIVGKTDGERNGIGITETLESKENKGKYTLYTYSFTFPSTQPDGLAFIGLTFPNNSEGYIFDIKLIKTDNVTAPLFSNGDFKSGLDHWTWGWDAWFETWGAGRGKTEWSNANVRLSVESFDESKFTAEAPAEPKDQMLYFKSKNTGPLMTRVNFVAGAEYTLSFGVSNNVTTFDIVGKTDGDRNGIGITETLVSKDEKEKYTRYTYSFTFPATQPDGLAFIGFSFPKNCEGYIFDIKLVKNDDATGKQLFVNGDFKSGLDHIAWDWDAWFETWGTGKGFTEYSTANVELSTMDFDESKFTIEIPESPKEQMLYFKAKNKGPLMTRVNFVSGAKYTLSFGVSNNVIDFDIIGRTDSDRKDFGITENLVSKEDKGKYTLYTYSFTFPGSQPDGLAFLGITFFTSQEGYLFRVSLTKEDDANQKQRISNGDFSSGLDNWAWDWDAWFVSFSGQTGTGKTEWSNANVTLNTMDFDESKFTIAVPEPPKEQMLYYKNSNAGPLMTRVSLTPGQKYTFSYYVSRNAIGTKVVAVTDGDHKNIAVNAKLISSKNEGRHTFCQYEFTVPSTFQTDAGKTTGLAFVGVKFILGYDGYFYGAKLTKADDGSQKQMLSNGDFSSGLDSWAWDWDAWFVNFPGQTGIGFKEWENKNIKLAVMDLDESRFSTEIPDVPVSDRRMLQFRNGANPTPFSARVNVTPGKSFIMSYSVFCTDETSLSVLTDDNRYVIQANEELLEKKEHTQYTTYTYRFAIPKTYQGSLAFVGVNIPYYAEGYLFNLSCYAAEDPQKKSVWQNADLMQDLDSWIWGWHAWFGMGTNENSYLKPKGMLKWTNGIDEIRIMDFDTKKIDALIKDINRDDGVWWSSRDYSEAESANSSAKAGKASLNGTFLKTDQTPIGNVKLILRSFDGEYTAYTDETGKFAFYGVLEGNYELYFVNAKGEEISTGFFGTLEAGDAVTVSLVSDTEKLEAAAKGDRIESFDGVVYTAKLKTVPNLKIYLRGFGEVKTDQNGHFEFTDVPVGEYELYTLLSNGKEYVFRKVTLQKDQKLSVKLKYDPPSASADEENGMSVGTIIAIVAASVGGVLLIGSGVLLFILKKRKKAR